MRICRELGVLDLAQWWRLPVEQQELWIAYYQADLGGDFLSPADRAKLKKG